MNEQLVLETTEELPIVLDPETGLPVIEIGEPFQTHEDLGQEDLIEPLPAA